MLCITNEKIQIVNSFDDQWPDVWGFLFLKGGSAPEELFDAIKVHGITKEEIEKFAQQLEAMKLESLTALAKEDITNDSPSPALVVLRRFPDSEILQFAKNLCHSAYNVEREIGLLILMDRTQDCSNPEYETFICNLLTKEASPNVISAALYALSKLHLHDCVAKIVRFAEHKDRKVREALAYTIAGEPALVAVATTLALMKDPCLEVRSWAIYLLSDNEDICGEDVENALFEAAHNPLNAREDKAAAILGLAKRKVAQAEELIRSSLNEDNCCPAIFQAASEMPSALYLPGLRYLQSNFTFGAYESSLLERAIEAVKAQE